MFAKSVCRGYGNFMYLLEGSPLPDHSTFARFRSLHLAPCSETIMAEMTNFLYEIYIYIKENGQLSYIKPANYEISKTSKYKNDISKIENMNYTEIGDYYTCKNNKKLTVNKILNRCIH